MSDNLIAKFEEYADLCAVHTAAWEEDCEVCERSADACRELFLGVQKNVTHLEQQMMAEGAMVDAGALNGIKLDVLVNMMLTNKGRAMFEFQYQQRLENEYRNLMGQLTQMRLMQGVRGGNKGQHGGPGAGGPGGGLQL